MSFVNTNDKHQLWNVLVLNKRLSIFLRFSADRDVQTGVVAKCK